MSATDEQRKTRAQRNSTLFGLLRWLGGGLWRCGRHGHQLRRHTRRRSIIHNGCRRRCGHDRHKGDLLRGRSGDIGTRLTARSRVQEQSLWDVAAIRRLQRATRNHQHRAWLLLLLLTTVLLLLRSEHLHLRGYHQGSRWSSCCGGGGSRWCCCCTCENRRG